MMTAKQQQAVQRWLPTLVRLFGGKVWRAGEAVGFDHPSVTKERIAKTCIQDYATEIHA